MANASKSALTKQTGFQKWWTLLRPHTLVASFVPVFLGTSVAMSYTSFHFTRFIVMLIACFFIQTSANLFNEYFDYKKGKMMSTRLEMVAPSSAMVCVQDLFYS